VSGDGEVVSFKGERKNYVVQAGRQFEIRFKVSIKDGWHINSQNPESELVVATELYTDHSSIEVVKLVYPPTHAFKLPYAEESVEVFEGRFEVVAVLAVAEHCPQGAMALPVIFSYQPCNKTSCKPPTSTRNVVQVTVKTPEAAPSLIRISGGQISNIALEQGVEETSDLAISNEVESGRILSSVDEKQSVTQEKQDGEKQSSLLVVLAFAMLGGLVLNLMPCVLPVLSLKIMSLVQHAGEARKEQLKHGFLFTLGVLIAFWTLAGVLIVLRMGGQQLGWGFQLQNPVFVAVLALFLYVFGLSLFGVFEIGLSLTTIAPGSNKKSSYGSSVFSGILATVVATPCTAPFMGTALGYAISKPPMVALTVFTALGLGMSAPYILITAFPGLLKFIPKPGGWMETLKQVMGFLLMGTVLWLIWVLSLQTGVGGVMQLLVAMILMAVASWIYGRWGMMNRPFNTRMRAWLSAGILMVLTLTYSVARLHVLRGAEVHNLEQGLILWQEYDEALIAEHRENGRPVLVDFTAAWCLSCQVNERVAFGNARVQKALIERNVQMIKADWTNKDERITQALSTFNRSSVPLYVYFVPGGEVKILPEIITPELILQIIVGHE